MTIYQRLDFLLMQHNRRVEWYSGDDQIKAGWVVIETVNGSDIFIHGKDAHYSMDDAYEDALRSVLNMIPIADEVKI